MKKSQEKLIQRGLILGSVLILLAAIAVFLFRGGGETQVVLHNIGECPNVMMIIRQADGGDTFTLEAGPGQTDRIDVKPNITYVYEIRFPAEADAANRFCQADEISEVTDDNTQIIFDRGQFAVPAGATQDFNIDSAREDPTQVVFNNTGDCPEASMIITAFSGPDNFTLTAASGETDSAKVEPEVTYAYEIRFPADLCTTEGDTELTEDGTEVIFESGQLTVTAGSTQTFNIDAQSKAPDEEAE